MGLEGCRSRELFSQSRTQQSIERADVVVFMFDVTQDVSAVDKQLAQWIADNEKPCVLVGNKWDLAREKIVTGEWHLKELYRYAYFPIAGLIWILGGLGRLPRVKPSTKGEGHERRYFYGSVWAVCFAQPALWLMWYIVPRGRAGDALKLVIFVAILAFVGNLARLGKLPRTRPIVPGEIAVSD